MESVGKKNLILPITRFGLFQLLINKTQNMKSFIEFVRERHKGIYNAIIEDVRLHNIDLSVVKYMKYREELKQADVIKSVCQKCDVEDKNISCDECGRYRLPKH